MIYEIIAKLHPELLDDDFSEDTYFHEAINWLRDQYQNQPQWIKTWTIERLKEMNEIEAIEALGVE